MHELTEAVQKQKDIASDLLKTAQDRFGATEHKVIREGKEVMLSEKILWQEVFYHPAGVKCEAGQLLKEAHPEVFEAYDGQGKAAMELKKFCLAELGVDFESLTLSDYLSLSEELFSLLINEAKEAK